METVEAIEKAIAQLGRDDLATFRDWFAAFEADQWDAQIEQDSAAGKLDELANAAIVEFEADKTKSLNRMVHHATQNFRAAYEKLPAEVRRVADKNFELLKSDPFHPSHHFKKVGRYWSVRAASNIEHSERDTTTP